MQLEYPVILQGILLYVNKGNSRKSLIRTIFEKSLRFRKKKWGKYYENISNRCKRPARI